MFRSISLGLATLALLAAPAAAESFDVPGDFKTIQDAVDAADDGDTIILGNQDFFENVVIDGKTDLRIVGKGQPVLDGGFLDSTLIIRNSVDIEIEKLNITGGDSHGIEIEDSSDVVISKCRIKENDGDAINAVRADRLEVSKCTIGSSDSGIVADDSDDVRIEKNKITDVLEDGISLSGGGDEGTSNDGRIEKNTICNADDGIVLMGTDNDVIKNKISNILDDAIDINDLAEEGGGGSSGNTVEKNQVKGAGEDGIILRGFNNTAEKNKVQDADGDGICLRGVGGHTVKKNTVLKAGNVAIRVGSGSNDNEIDGNSCTQPDGDAMDVESDNNDILNNKSNKAGEIGFEIDGTNNRIKGNKASKSGNFGLSDSAGGNTYEKNKFDSVDPKGFDPED